eukprot:5896981-Amphidinium_carterae.1
MDPPPVPKPPPQAKATSKRASSRGKTPLPEDKWDGSKIMYSSMYKDLRFDDPFRFDLIPATAIKFRKERNTYFGEIQPNVSSTEVRNFHTNQMRVQDANRASDNWHRNNAYKLGDTARRSMIPALDPANPRPICIVLEPFHDKDFTNGIEFQYGHTAYDCFRLSKNITTTSRKYRGPADGWLRIEDFDYSYKAWDTRLLLLSCCYGNKPRIELMITSNAQPRVHNDLDITVLK